MQVQLPINGARYWIYADWQKNDAWKNDILISLQKKLLERDPSMPSKALRLFTQQLVQENGGLDPLLITGDHGMAYGLGQWNSSSARRMRERVALRKPDGSFDRAAELNRQLDLLAEEMVNRLATYGGSIRVAIVAHNCPDCANARAKPAVCSGIDAYHRKLHTCYFDDEVNGPKLAAHFVSIVL